MHLQKKPEAPRKPEEPKGQKPLVTAFALVKREKQWHALALRVRGREVMEERILESTDWLEVAESVASRCQYDFAHFDVDPFRES